MMDNGGWKVIGEDDEAQNIPLWKALAQFTSTDLDEGLKANAAIINPEKASFQRHYNIGLVVSAVFGAFFLISLLLLLILAHSKFVNALFFLVLTLLAATVAPLMWRQVYQYGLKIPDEPLNLPHAADRHFEEFLGHLQRVSGPQAYRLARFGKKRKPFNRRQFFGRLRYFHFSESSTVRGMVMRFPTAFSVSDIYLHRDDVQKIVAMAKTKRKGGTGRDPKYRYADAIVALIGDPRLAELDLNAALTATGEIEKILSDWFDSNADASGDVPRKDLVQPYAKKIYARLNLISPTDRR